MLKVVKNLGLIYNNCKVKAQWSEVQCPKCNTIYKLRTGMINKRKSCRNCSNRTGTMARDGLKICSTCSIEKSVEEFTSRKKAKDGLRSQCNTCISTASAKRWKDNPDFKQRGMERSRKHSLMKNYGITIDQFNTMSKEVNHACEICKTHVNNTGTSTLYVDHDHITGNVRGLLCRHCNTALGMFKDSITTMQEAIKYIERTTNENTNGSNFSI